MGRFPLFSSNSKENQNIHSNHSKNNNPKMWNRRNEKKLSRGANANNITNLNNISNFNIPSVVDEDEHTDGHIHRNINEHLPPNASNIISSESTATATTNIQNNVTSSSYNKRHHSVVKDKNTGVNLSIETPRTSNLTNYNNAQSSPQLSHHSHNQYHAPYAVSSSNSGSSQSAATATSRQGTANTSISYNRKLPGVFTYIQQGKWSEAAERAKRHPRECKKWTTIKKSGAAATSSSSSSSPKILPNHLKMQQPSMTSMNTTGGGGDFVHSTSFATMDTNSSICSATTTQINNQFHYVKCKALHHACHKLRTVHSHIRKLISISLREFHEHTSVMEGRGSFGANTTSGATGAGTAPVKSNNTSKQNSNAGSSVSSRCPSACNVTDGLSFDSTDDSSTLNRFVNYVQGNNNHNNYNLNQNGNHQEEEWDDPWIEACKAILTILKIYPEAAGERESKHGCLPLHLAVFAMCDTPTVTLPKNYHRLNKQELQSPSSPYCPSTPPTTVRRSNGGGNSGKSKTCKQISSAPPSTQQHSTKEITLPPRPLQLFRGKSNSSTASTSVASYNTLGGISAALFDSAAGGACGNSFVSDDTLTNKIDELEKKLRMKQSLNGDSVGITDDEEKMVLQAFSARPSPIKSCNDRAISSGSVNSNSSAVSTNSTVMTSTFAETRNSFSLEKYIQNKERREEYSLKVINALLNAYKRGAKVDSEGGRLPLHTAVAGRATLKVIETLITAYPHATRHRTFDASLPLHLAASYGVSDVEVAPMLLRTYPDASVGKNRWERTPMEEGLIMGGENGREHQVELMAALRKNPIFWSGDYAPPHQAMERARNVLGFTDVDALLKGEWSTNNRNEAEKKLLDLDDLDEEVNLVTLIRRQKWDTITDKINFFTSMIQTPLQGEVRAGYLAKSSALYLTCERSPTYEVLDALLSVCPGAITWRKIPGGQLPLHAACTWQASLPVVGFLIAANPQAVKLKDYLGNLPLHCACFSGASEDIIESLLCTHPKAVDVRNSKGSTPLDIVRRLSHNNRKNVLNLIERVSLELLKKKRQSDDVARAPSHIVSAKTNTWKRKSKSDNTKEEDTPYTELLKNTASVESTDGNIELEISEESELWV